jgi:hypothetical protein
MKALRRRWYELRIRLVGFEWRRLLHWRWLCADFNDCSDPVEILMASIGHCPVAKEERFIYRRRVAFEVEHPLLHGEPFEIIALFQSRVKDHPRLLNARLKLLRSVHKVATPLIGEKGELRLEMHYWYFIRYSYGSADRLDGHLQSATDTEAFTCLTYGKHAAEHNRLFVRCLEAVRTIDRHMCGRVSACAETA